MPIIMGLVPTVILFVVSLIAAIFSFWWGGVIYVMGIYVTVAIIVVSSACVQPPDDPMGARETILSADEERLFRKYCAFFRFPFGTQNFALSSIMRGLILGLWQGVWGVAIASVVFYLISGPLMWRLSPMHTIGLLQRTVQHML